VQCAGLIDEHEPDPVGIQQALGRAQQLPQRHRQALFDVEGVQRAKAADKLRWSDRHGLSPFRIADDLRTRPAARP
jgi:hypothetical protein